MQTRHTRGGHYSSIPIVSEENQRVLFIKFKKFSGNVEIDGFVLVLPLAF